MFGFKKSPPLNIEVTDTSWFAFGELSLLSQHFKYECLRRAGGVSNGVPPGWYHFDVKWRGWKLIYTLEPFEN